MSHHESACCKGVEETLAAQPEKAGTRLLKLIDLLRANAEGIRAAIPTEDEAVAWVNGLYDKYIAPQDIPWVPDVLEKTIDDAAKAVLEQIVRAVYPG